MYIERALDEADKAAAESKRYTEEEVFGRIKESIKAKIEDGMQPVLDNADDLFPVLE